MIQEWEKSSSKKKKRVYIIQTILKNSRSLVRQKLERDSKTKRTSGSRFTKQNRPQVSTLTGDTPCSPWRRWQNVLEENKRGIPEQHAQNGKLTWKFAKQRPSGSSLRDKFQNWPSCPRPQAMTDEPGRGSSQNPGGQHIVLGAPSLNWLYI